MRTCRPVGGCITLMPYRGWGAIPDQYGCRWADDDGEGDEPANPGTSDLPALQPGWGPQLPS